MVVSDFDLHVFELYDPKGTFSKVLTIDSAVSLFYLLISVMIS